jgi:hypothetical protein
MAARTKKDTDEAKASADAQGEQTQEQIDEDAKRHEAEAKANADNAGKLAASSAAAQAATDANQARQVKDQQTRQSNLSVGKDPETGDDVEDDGEFAGQLITSDFYGIVTRDNVGRGVLEIKPAGWVGPGFEVPANRVADLKKALGQVKNLPKE